MKMECFTCGQEVDFGINMCHSCGINYGRVFEKIQQVQIYSKRKTQIEKDFEDYEIPVEIKGKAAIFYNQVTNGDILKDANRRGMMWMCCYEAYKHHGIAKDPILLSILFKLKKKQMNRALRSFWERVHKNNLMDEFPKIQLSVPDLIPVFRDLYDIEEIAENSMINIYMRLETYSTNIMKYRPRDVAASIVFWFIVTSINNDDTINQNTTSTTYCSKCCVGKTTLDKIVKCIKQIEIR